MVFDSQVVDAQQSWASTSSNLSSESYHKKTDSYYPPQQNNSSHNHTFNPTQGFAKGITNYISSNFLPQNTRNNFGNYQNPSNTSDSQAHFDSESLFADNIMTSRDRSQEFAGILRYIFRIVYY